MSGQKFRINIQTNNGIRFITAISTSQSIRQILPILLQKYHSVVQQNLHEDQYDLQQYKCNHINQISTKDGYLIPLDDIVQDVFNDNDHILINLTKKTEAKKQKSKKQITENKIKEKEAKQKSKEEKQAKKKQQKTEKKEEKPVVINKNKNNVQNKQKSKVQDNKQGNKNDKDKVDFKSLLIKFRSDGLSKNQVTKQKKTEEKKSKYQVVEESSSSN